MKKTIQTIVLAALCLFLSSAARTQTAALKIGDQVPDITINNIINYKSSSAKLSDFKGKLLILDFWATWCSPCVAMIPKMDSLEKAFKGKVQFLSVTYQDEKVVTPFMEKLQKQNNKVYQIPGVMGDKVLKTMFPHVYLPHYIWIDHTGIVKAITGFEEVNSKNIQSILSENNLNVPERKEFRADYDKVKPLLINGNGGNGSSLLYHSMFASYTEGLSGGYDVFKADSVSDGKIVIRNVPVNWFYGVAFREDGHFGKNRTLLEVRDSSAFMAPAGKYLEWIKKNGYCYEIVVPPAMSDQIYPIMKEDLRRFFSAYNAGLEKRKTKCLTLVRTSAVDKLKSRGGLIESRFNALGCSMRNTFLSLFTGQLSVIYLQKSPMPVINDTGYTGRVDMEINASLSDLAAVNKELARYDLKFIEAEKDIDMLVIRDR